MPIDNEPLFANETPVSSPMEPLRNEMDTKIAYKQDNIKKSYEYKKSNLEYKKARLGLNNSTPEELQTKLSNIVDKQIYKNPDGTVYQQVVENGQLVNKPFYGKTENVYIDNTEDGQMKLGLAGVNFNARYNPDSPEAMAITNSPGWQKAKYKQKDVGNYGVTQDMVGKLKNVNTDGSIKPYGWAPGEKGVTPEDGALMDITVPYNDAVQFEYDVHSNIGQIKNRSVGQGPISEEDAIAFGSGKTEYTSQNAPMWNINYKDDGSKLEDGTPVPKDIELNNSRKSKALEAMRAARRSVNTDDDNRVGELVDMAQASIVKSGADTLNMLTKLVGKDNIDKASGFLDKMDAYLGGDGKAGIFIEDDGSIVDSDKNVYDYRDLQTAQKEFGVSQKTILEHNVAMKKSEQLWEHADGISDYIESMVVGMSQLDRILANSAGEMAETMIPGGPALLAATRTSNYAEEYKKNNGKDMSPGKLAQTFFSELAVIIPEKLLVKSGVTSLFEKLSKKTRVGKVAISGAGEGFQEYGEGITESVATQKEGNQSLYEIATDPKTVYQGALGVGMGTGTSTAGAAIGTVTGGTVSVAKKILPKDKTKDKVKAEADEMVRKKEEIELQEVNKIDVDKADTSKAIEDAFNVLVAMEEVETSPTALKAIQEKQSLLADKLMALDERDMKFGSEQKAVDTIESVIDNKNGELTENEIEKLTKIAEMNGLKNPEAMVNRTIERVKKDFETVRRESTELKGGYKQQGRSLRGSIDLHGKDSAVVKAKIEKLQLFRATTKNSITALESKLADAEMRFKKGTFPAGGVEVSTKDYMTSDGKPFVIHKSSIESKTGGIYSIIKEKKKTVRGINDEARYSGVSLDTDKIVTNDKIDKIGKQFKKTNKIIAYGKDGSIEKEIGSLNKEATNSKKYTDQDTVAVIMSAPKGFTAQKMLTAMKNDSNKNSAAWTGKELDKAIKAGATVVTGAAFTGKKPNVGSMAVRAYLIEKGYVAIDKDGFKDKRKTTFVHESKAKDKPVTEKEESDKSQKEEETKKNVEDKIKSVDQKSANRVSKLQDKLAEEKKKLQAVYDKYKGAKKGEAFNELINKVNQRIQKIKDEINKYTNPEAMNNIVKDSISSGMKPIQNQGQAKQILDISKVVKVAKKIKNLFVTMETGVLPQASMDYAYDSAMSIIKILAPHNESNAPLMMKDSPARGLIFDKNGDVNVGVAASIQLAADEYMAFNSSYLDPKTREDLARMLGKSEFDITYDMVKAFKDKGLLRKHMADSIGKAAVANMGISSNKEIDEDTYIKLVGDIGNIGILMLEKEGAVKTSSMATIEFGKAINEPFGTENKKAKVLFVQMGKNKEVVKDKQAIFETISQEIGVEDQMRKGVHRKPVDDKEDEKARKNDIADIPERAKEALGNLRKEKFVKVESGIKWLKDEKNQQTARKHLGYTLQDELEMMSAKEQEAKIAINRDIDKSIDELLSLEEDEFFFDWFFTRNGRFILDSNTVNPQTDKLHRFLLVPSKQTVTINKNNQDEMNAWYHALAQAFGMGTDKAPTQKTYDQGKALSKIDPDRLLEALSNEKMMEAINKRLPEPMEVEHLGHWLQATESIRESKKSNKKFDTNLSAEFDAVTSGFGIKLMQMPIIADIERWLNKVGVFKDGKNEQGDAVQSMNDQLNVDGFLDSYQELAQEIKPNEMDSPTKEQDPHGLWKSMIDSLPQSADSGVSKELRTLFKGPFMTFNYAAGINAIKKSLGYTIVDDIINEMAKDGEQSLKWGKLYEQVARLTKKDRKGTLQELLREQDADYIMIKNGKKTVSLSEYMRDIISATYGKQVEESLNSKFGKFVAANNTVNNSFRAMYRVFAVKYESEINKLEEAGKAITKEAKAAIIEKHMNSLPVIMGPDSTMEVKDGVLIIGSKVLGRGLKTGKVQTHLANKTTISVQSLVREMDAAINSGSVIPTHFIDGSTMSGLINKIAEREQSGLYIHDAIIPGITNMVEAVKTYNEEWFKRNQKYSIIANVDRAMERVAKTIGKDEIERFDVFFKEGEYQVGSELEAGKYSVSFEDIHAMTKNLANEVASKRNKLFKNNMSVFHMAAVPGSGFDSKDITNEFVAEKDNRTIGKFEPVFKPNDSQKQTIEDEKVKKSKETSQKDADKIKRIIEDSSFGSSEDTGLQKAIEEVYIPTRMTLSYGGKPKYVDVQKITVKKDRDIVTLHVDGAQYDFTIGATQSLETNKGRSVVVDEMAKVTTDIYNAIGAYEAFGSSKKGKSKSETAYVELEEGINRDTEGMVKMAEALEELSETKSSENHKKWLVELLRMVDPMTMPKLKTYLNTTAAENRGEVNLKNKKMELNISKGNTSHKSPMEVYVHEITHAFTVNALDSKNQEVHKTIRRVQFLMDKARKVVKWQDFRPAKSIDKVREDRQAKAMYEYIFNNKKNKGLEEFVSHGLTNESLINKLKGIKLRDDKKVKTGFEALIQIFHDIMNIITGKFLFKTRNNTAFEELISLSMDLSRANNKALKRYKSDEKLEGKIEKLLHMANKTVGSLMKDIALKLAGTNVEAPPLNASKIEYGIWLTKNLPKLMMDERLKPIVSQVLKAMGHDYGGTLQNIMRDVRTPDAVERMVERLGLYADNVDTERQAITTAARDAIVGAFEKDFDISDREALTSAALETDLSSIYDVYGESKTKEMLANDLVLEKEIKTALSKLKREDKANFYWHMNQAKGLGHYMNSGEAGLAQLLNADNIVKQYGTKKRVYGDENLIAMVDQLATLYALRGAPHESKVAVSNMMTKHSVGVKNFINMHNMFKSDSKKKLFKNSPHEIKGYVKEIYDDSVSVEIKPLSMREEMAKDGFVLEQTLKKDPLDTSREPMGIYRSTTFSVSSYTRQATRITDAGRRGTSLTDVRYKGDEQLAYKMAMEDKKLLDVKRKRVEKLMRGGVYKARNVSLSPMLNDKGDVINYRYMMNNDLKRELLNPEKRAPTILAGMIGSVTDKVETIRHNDDVLKFILSDMKENYIKGSISGKNGYEYVKISKDSHIDQVKEIYTLLPQNMKDAIANTEDKYIAVRADQLNAYFGMREAKMEDAHFFGLKLMDVIPKELRGVIRVAEAIWQEIVKISKVDIVIRTPAVLIGNLVSNFMYSVMSGTSPVKVARRTIENSRNVIEYLKQKNELDGLKLNRDSGNAVKSDLKKIGSLEESLMRNPVHKLMKVGMYQAIVEDVSKKDFESSNRLSTWADRKMGMLPEVVKSGVDMLYLTEKTSFFKMMTQATQMSDLVARVTEFQLLTERGVNEETAINTVLDVFINYNKVSSSLEDWANRMGFVMFTKYVKRIQRAISQGVADYPVTFLMSLIGQEFVFGDISDIADQNVFKKDFGVVGYTPTEMFDHAWRTVMPTSVEFILDPKMMIGK